MGNILVMGRKTRLKKMKKMNRKQKEKIIAMFREVQTEAEELRSLAKDKEEIEVDWCSFDLLPPPMFTGKYFDLWVIRMPTFV